MWDFENYANLRMRVTPPDFNLFLLALRYIGDIIRILKCSLSGLFYHFHARIEKLVLLNLSNFWPQKRLRILSELLGFFPFSWLCLGLFLKKGFFETARRYKYRGMNASGWFDVVDFCLYDSYSLWGDIIPGCRILGYLHLVSLRRRSAALSHVDLNHDIRFCHIRFDYGISAWNRMLTSENQASLLFF